MLLIIDSFMKKAADDKKFIGLLLQSLQKAEEKARKSLTADLFSILPWPLDLEAYYRYLVTFSQWIPKESKEAVWLIPGTNGHQEIDDRTNHFYWLIDQPVGENETTLVEDIPWFSQWLIQYAQNWGSYLNTALSFNSITLESFANNAPLYRVNDSLLNGKANNPSGWLTFNQFFARELNPGLRPISQPFDNRVIVSPADCNYKSQYAISADSTIPEITIKNTHRFSSIPQLLEDSAFQNVFGNGTFVHYYLSTFSYHRFHTPVAGIVKECYPIQGMVYLDVTIKNGQFDSPDNAEDGYEFAQARGVIIIDTALSPYGNIGLVAVLPIGMCQVSSVNMIATVGSNMLKGDEFGYFLFGGSDIIVLFQEGINPIIDRDESYRLYGSKIATGNLKVE